jgi:hypothetical protein
MLVLVNKTAFFPVARFALSHLVMEIGDGTTRDLWDRPPEILRKGERLS